MQRARVHTLGALAGALFSTTLLGALEARAQSCPAGSLGCAQAPLSFTREVGLPFSFDIDTGWVPSGSPLQVRFVAALVGRTRVSAAGALRASWPAAMRLEALPTAGSGSLLSDYGVQLDARVRVDFGAGARWEGSIPYVPHVDFRVRGERAFDPWAWQPVTVSSSTARQHVADVALTDLLVRIPGISGGLSFDIQADLSTSYRSLRIDFGGDADPLTETIAAVQGAYTAGPTVTYLPQLQGRVTFSSRLHVFPSLYVDFLGRRTMVDLLDLPLPIGPFDTDWNFDRATARLDLSDVVRDDVVVDFGRVTVGEMALDAIPLHTAGVVPVWFHAPMDDVPFFYPTAERTVPPVSRGALPVGFRPSVAGRVERRIPLQTSDPDTPSWFVTLRGEGVEPPADVAVLDAALEAAPDAPSRPPGDAPAEAQSDARLPGQLTGDGACACSSAPGSSTGTTRGLLAALPVVLAALRRRARTRGRSPAAS